jgi:hypothetical protein
MNASRDFHTATLLTSGPNAGKVLMAGGRSGSSGAYTYPASAELYDPATGAFTLLSGSMTAARYGHTATIFNGKVLIVGGAQASALASAECFDPNATAAPYFTATGSLATARQYFTAFLYGSSLVAAGGRGSTRLMSAEMDTGAVFISAGNMTTPRAGHTATTLVSGAVLIVGGEGSSGVSVTTAELLQ